MSITEIYIRSKKDPTLVYKFEDITPNEAEIIAKELLTNPISQNFQINKSMPAQNGNSTIEVAYKPGVIDPVEESLREKLIILGINPTQIKTSKIYTFTKHDKPDLNLSQLEEIVINKPKTLVLNEVAPGVEKVPITTLDNEKLAVLSKNRSLFLGTHEIKAIQEHFRKLKREPTDVEIETIAQTWSEHNSHKTFKSEFITPDAIIKESPITRIKKTSEKYFENAEVVTAFKDNAGGIRFYDGLAIISKFETHIGPSATEPFGGSATGIGGVLRDIDSTGLGGENLFMLVINNFADPNMNEDDVLEGCLHPLKHLTGVINGQSDYGNKMGIPTLGIDLHFHNSFAARPTVLGGAIGIIPEKYSQKGKPRPGDLVVSIGGKTGKDGIHGATFSSGSMTHETKTIHASAVQIGNAIEQKRMFDALNKARDLGLIIAKTDCGGGGYSSAIGEMGEETGVEVDLDNVPLKYKGLAAWEIWLSESQERTVVAIDPSNWEKFKKICDLFETPADIIGKFTNDKNLKIKHKNEIVADLSMDFLHNGCPRSKLCVAYKKRSEINDIPNLPVNWKHTFESVLSHLNICSKEEILTQYDKSVKAATAIHYPADAGAVVPIYGKNYAVLAASAINPKLTGIDPYEGTKWVIAEAVIKYTAIGGNFRNAALIDNYICPTPTKEVLGDIDRGTDALCEMLDVLKLPCVSGKDSLSSTYKGKDGQVLEIPYTFNVTIFGKIPDVYKTISPDFKEQGSIICWIGDPDLQGLGGSIYFDVVNTQNSRIPKVNLNLLPEILESINNAVKKGGITACKAVGEGGIAAAISQMCFKGNFGAVLDLNSFNTRPDFVIFNETPSFIVELKSLSDIEKYFKHIPHKMIGVTTSNYSLKLTLGSQTVFDLDLNSLKNAWEYPMKKYFSR